MVIGVAEQNAVPIVDQNMAALMGGLPGKLDEIRGILTLASSVTAQAYGVYPTVFSKYLG